MVRTRIAPSPTGNDLHIGSLYTALINYAFAKKHGGKFIVRIEDTDRERFVEGAEEKFISTLEQFGLVSDENPIDGGPHGPYRQSERLQIYKTYVQRLIQNKTAYYCTCTKERLEEMRNIQIKSKQIPRYDKHCIQHQDEILRQIQSECVSYVIRLNVPENQDITFRDEIRGDITINTNQIDDQVLLKSDGFPTYHLAVVIDDHLMGITHIIRAEEWINSTPKHILLYKAFGFSLPHIAHVPLLRNPDKSKLSKRKNPVFASWYLSEGYLPEAMLNFLALMGWSHPEEKEIFDINEFIKVVDFKDFKPVGPAFDVVKLTWMNGEYIRKMSNEELVTIISNFFNGIYSIDVLNSTVPLIKERIKKLIEYKTLCECFYKEPDSYEISLGDQKELLDVIYSSLKVLEKWDIETIGMSMADLAKKYDIKNSEFFMILRVVITGKKISPPLNDTMVVLGKDTCLLRIENALHSLI
ncbi:MAG: glutamate--tRNA ligase [Candidatus Roizmanbacteria bacterium]